MNAQLATVQPGYNFFESKSANPTTRTDELLLLNEEISQLFEQRMSGGIVAVNEEGSILSFNGKAGEIFGYSAKEAIGKNVGDLILLEYPDKLDSCIINFLKLSGEMKFLDRLCEASGKSEKGSIVPLRFSVGKTQFDDRLLITVTVQQMNNDTSKTNIEQLLIKKLTEANQLLVNKNTELDEYNNLLRKESVKRKHLADKLRLSQAMSSIDARFIKAGRLAEQIAHDFNSLLVPLSTYPALLKSKLPEGSECVEYCDTMEKIAQRLTQVNDQLIALMSFNRQNNVAFDVNLILSEAVNLVSNYFNNEVKIENAISKEAFTVNGRPEELYRVFFNLLLNAKDALREGDGQVTVTSEKVKLDVAHRPKDPYLSNEFVKITIADTGTGIPIENLNKIFEPFYTTKNGTKQKSSGLGLTIVRDMIKDHNGFVEVESEVGQGTTFAVHIPIKSSEE